MESQREREEGTIPTNVMIFLRLVSEREAQNSMSQEATR